MNQRALERDALPHAAREADTRIVRDRRGRPARARAAPQRRIRAPVEAGEERQVLERGQLGIEKQVVAEDADAAAKRRAIRPRIERTEPDAPEVGRSSVASIASSRRLAGAVRAKQTEDRAGACREADV